MTLICNDRVGSTMIASWVYIPTIRSVCIGWQLHICTNGILSLADDLYGTRWRGANELESSVMMEVVIDNNTISRSLSGQCWRCEACLGTAIAPSACMPGETELWLYYGKTELWLCYVSYDLTMVVILLV